MKKYLSLSLLLLFFISCSSDEKGDAANASNTDSLKTQAQGEVLTPEEIKAKEVEGITAESVEFQIPVQTVGSVKATKKGKITAEVNGIVSFDFIYEGQEFKKGQLLARIKDFQFQLNKEKQIASFERKYIDFLQNDLIAKEFYGLKAMPLLKKIQASKNPNIIGRARTTGLYEELLNLKLTFQEEGKRRIYAPSNLVISKVNIENGQNVGNGTALFDYIYAKDKVVEVSLFENECAYLRVGQKAVIKRQAVITNDEYVATVIGISKQISQDRFRKVTLRFDSDNNLVDGEQVELTLNINTGRFGIQVPNDAIVYRDQRAVVFVVEGKQALWKYVQVGERFGDNIEIVDGIKNGDLVITKGHFTLAHQATVNFKKAR